MEYFAKHLENDLLEKKDMSSVGGEIIVWLIFGIFFLINLFTNFYNDDFSTFGYICIFVPAVACLIAPSIVLKTKSKQSGRLFKAIFTIFLGLCWTYLFAKPVWYNASQIWLIGSFVTNDLFYWFVLGGVIFPYPVGISSLIIYLGVKREKNK